MSFRVVLRRARRVTTSIILPVGIALLVRATLVQAYHIPSGSMEDTLFPGDFVLAEKVTFGPTLPGRLPGVAATLPSLRVPGLRQPHPGEVVIFQHPEDPSVDLIKRVVATAGQTVEVRDKVLYVDGRAAPLPSGSKHGDPHVQAGNRDNFGPYVVPAGEIFVMGDNRDNSFDSRFFGAVPLTMVRARPLAVYFSWNGAARLRYKIRWTHLGHLR
jgi:signal peptidase I